ncbi:inositol-3-phosphate synthase [Candidatus Micrarchaeota archaeon]|nr:inositol-3-phosphate synthase [Candidatus Micrarchaeota archaeon]
MGKKIKVGVVGVGNCFAGLVQGIEYYRQNPERKVTGIMNEKMAGYSIHDVEIVSAFDVSKRKVGKRLDQAIYAYPNMVDWIELPKMETVVSPAPVLDGVGHYVKDMIDPIKDATEDELKDMIIDELKRSKTEIIISYLPVGSQKAAEFWANMCLETKTAFINCMPVFIASNPVWEKKFKKAKVPAIGDDIKGQIGATITHRVLAKMFTDRGVIVDDTYQLNVGGNTDFKNMLERSRLESKEISKTNSVQSQLSKPLPKDKIHIGPSDYVEFLKNTKIAFMRLRGHQWGDRPLNLEVKLEVDDKSNSGGIAIDAIRAAKIALDRGLGGSLYSASAYLMKTPPKQFRDETAKQMLEDFVSGKRND